MFGAEYFTLVGSWDAGYGCYCLKCTKQEYTNEHPEKTTPEEDEVLEWLQRDEERSAIMEAEAIDFSDGLWCENCGEEIFAELCANCGDNLGEGSGEVSAMGEKLLSHVYRGQMLCKECMKEQAKAEQEHATSAV